MIYARQLPKLKQLRQLASEIENFPITGLGIVQYAEHSGYDKEIVNFLQQFSHRMVFNSRSDFMNHCSLLERLFKQEVQSMPEQLRSPQD